MQSKKDMYRRLATGEFGNTNPFWTDVLCWLADWRSGAIPLWGIRSMSPGDHRLRLDVPAAYVPDVSRTFTSGYQISPMIDHCLTFRGEVVDLPGGPYLQGVVGLRDVKWREALKDHSRHWHGSSVNVVLSYFLWDNDLDNMTRLREEFPGHVVEFTACDRAVGLLDGHNTVIWEVRAGDGVYERECK